MSPIPLHRLLIVCLFGMVGCSPIEPVDPARGAAIGSDGSDTAASPNEPGQPPPLTHRTTPQAERLMARGDAAAAPQEIQAGHPGAAHDSYMGWPPPVPADRERYTRFDDNPVQSPASDPVSTFSIDVDTASYARVRRFLDQGQLPHPDAIRTEELVNYFDYAYPAPTDRHKPFAVHLELGPSPWHPERQLLHIGLKGWTRSTAELPPANLVFLVDVSGSMQGPDRIDLLRASLKLLAGQLRPQDRISIAVYAGAAGIVLEPTPGDQRARIIAALDALEAGGSTNGGAGIQLAYALARQHLAPDGINRVILATDGDFNVGMVDQRALERLIARERDAGIGLTVLGFGMGNYNDALMQHLAQTGNGNAAYIDTLNEARKVLVDELASTLEIIARDVKIQVEFNPAAVAEYRLIGYETRHLERADFANDRVDAGDIGAGHTVTALYEITPVGATETLLEPLRYEGARPPVAARAGGDEIAFVRLRYKLPGAAESRLLEHPVHTRDAIARLDATSADYRFAAAVAGFGQLLRGGRYTGGFGHGDVMALARGARDADPFGYRGEFLGLAGTAAALAGHPVASH